MVTSVIMERKMGSFNVLQRTKDGYFDASSLLSQWNLRSENPKREMKRFLDSPKTLEFVEAINDDSPIAEKGFGLEGAYSVKKGRNTAKGKTKDEVWMHPYLFIDFAMWLNPKFKLAVIKFVYDELIKQRNLAGDNYKSLSSSLVKLKGYSFTEVATALQWIVYNKKGKNLRQTASQEQLSELSAIQEKLSFAIDMNYITSYNQLLDEMRKIWHKKHVKF